MIISIIQAKGGVGKTTTAVNLSHSLAMQKKRVLLVDLDSQSSASFHLGVKRQELAPSICEVLMEDLSLEDAIRETSISGLHLITGSMGLANFDVNYSSYDRRTEILKDLITDIIPEYDTIIFDCPPTMGLLPINALVACNRYLVPIVPHYLALEGLVSLMDAIDRIKAGLGAKCELLGLLLTMVDQRTKLTGEISEMLRRQFGKSVFKTIIPLNIRVAEAPSFGGSVIQHDWSCAGAEAYQALGKEIKKLIEG